MKVRVISGNVKYGGKWYEEGQTFDMTEELQDKDKQVLKALVSNKKKED